MAATMEAPALTEQEKIFRWRMGHFLDLKFSVPQAEALADANYVDWHRAEALIVEGCPHDLAFDILI